MTCEYTWPNHLLGSDKAAVGALLEQHGLQGDVAFGHSKLFIRSPRTLVTLEQSRACLDPVDIGNLISGSSAFSKTSLSIWKFTVHVLLKPVLENFEHYFTSV